MTVAGLGRGDESGNRSSKILQSRRPPNQIKMLKPSSIASFEPGFGLISSDIFAYCNCI